VQVTGVGTTPVPAGASATVLNVTVTNTKSSGFLTVFPEGIPPPTVSSLNFVANQNLSVYPAPAMTTQPDFSDVNWGANGIVPNFTIADTNGTGSVEV
jgi:hypothetical protein